MLPRHISIIIISLLLAACSTETGKKLTHADSVMEQHPDSAMSILADIDRNTLKDSELPYFALLYTQAQVKTDVPLDSDSLISIAYAKYSSDTRGDRGIRSNFYTGEVFFNQNKYREAMRYYLTAYEESKRLNNDYWHAKAAERISDLFFFAYKYDEAESYAQEAAELYKQENRQINYKYILGALSNIWLNNGNADRAYMILDSLRNLSLNENPIDSSFLEYIKMPLNEALIMTGRNEEINFNDWNIHRDDLSDREKIDVVILESQIFNKLDNTEELKDRFTHVQTFAHSEEDTIHILYAGYENAKACGDKDLAISLVDSMLHYQNALAENVLQESVAGAQSEFYSDLAFRNDQKSILFKWLLWGAIVVSLFVITFLIIIFHLRNKAQKAKLQANLESLLSLKARSAQIAKEKDILEKSLNEKNNQRDFVVSQLQAVMEEKNQQEIIHAMVVEKLFKEKWTTLDTLCDQYFGLNNSELTAKALVLNIEKELKKIISKKGLAEIVEAVDIYMGEIVTKLRNQCPSLKDEDINFLALLFAGFSVRAVCMFTGIKYPHFYVKKSRLIKRIEASEASDKSLFLEKLK
ncbi:MAG: tetratricopeptide repeat protein [Muribaculaceae bacterium]|nr:tetratricopeptide repeat protein [Muribaculaceae bacterium]